MKSDDELLRGRVRNKVSIVTGAGSGIGRATAILLSREGGRVAVADIDESAAFDTCKLIASNGGEALGLRLDVTSEEEWENAIKEVFRAWGTPDILINNAGISFAKPVAETSLDEWRRLMAVNLDGVFLGTRAGIRSMRERGRGSIVNISSASGIKASPGATAYCASKAAVIHFSRTAALECAQNGLNIRINTVLPAGVKTAMWRTMETWADVERSETWNAGPDEVPLKRFAQPEEIAQAVLFLASDESSYVTGTELVIDGGYTA
jgi:3(or 17)beta-hydroxysteroid dehydrogenase